MWRWKYTGWRTKCHTTDCAHNTFLLLQKQLRAHIVKLCRALSEDLCRKVVTNAKGSFARGCEAKRWSHWTCFSLGTIFQPMRINSVPGVKCFCNNKNVLRAQSMVWHFVRYPIFILFVSFSRKLRIILQNNVNETGDTVYSVTCTVWFLNKITIFR